MQGMKLTHAPQALLASPVVLAIKQTAPMFKLHEIFNLCAWRKV